MSQFTSVETQTYEQAGNHSVTITNKSHYAVEKVTEGNASGTEQVISGGEDVIGSLNTGLKRATNAEPVTFTATTQHDYYVHGKPIKFKVNPQVASGQSHLGSTSVNPSGAASNGILETDGTATVYGNPNGICTFSQWTGDTTHLSSTTSDGASVTGVDDGDQVPVANFNCVTGVIDPLKQTIVGGNVSWVAYNGFVSREKRCDFYKYGASSSEINTARNNCKKPFFRYVSGYYEVAPTTITIEYEVNYSFVCGGKYNPSGGPATPTPTTSNTWYMTDCTHYKHITSIEGGSSSNEGYTCVVDDSSTYSAPFPALHLIYTSDIDSYPEYLMTAATGSIQPPCTGFDMSGAAGMGDYTVGPWMFRKTVTQKTLTYELSGQSNYPRYYPETTTFSGSYITKLDGQWVDDESPQYITYYTIVNGELVGTIYQRVLNETVYVKKYTGTQATDIETIVTNPATNTRIRYDEKDCGTFNGWYTYNGSDREYYGSGDTPARELTLNSDTCCEEFYTDVTTCDDGYYPYGLLASDGIVRIAYMIVSGTPSSNDYDFTVENATAEMAVSSYDDGTTFSLQPNTTVYSDGLLFMEAVSSGREYEDGSGTYELVKATTSGSGYKIVNKLVNNTDYPVLVQKFWILEEDFVRDAVNDPLITVGTASDLENVISGSPLYFYTNWGGDTNFVAHNSEHYYNGLIYMADCAVNKSVVFMTCKDGASPSSLNYLLGDPAKYVEYGWYYNDSYTRYRKTYTRLGPNQENVSDPVTFTDGRVALSTDLFSYYGYRIELTNSDENREIYDFEFLDGSNQWLSYNAYDEEESSIYFPKVIYGDGVGYMDPDIYTMDQQPVYSSEHYVYNDSTHQWESAENGSGDTYTYIKPMFYAGGFYGLCRNANGTYGYRPLPTISTVTDFENALLEEIPFIYISTSFTYDGVTYTSGLHSLSSDYVEYDSSDPEYTELFNGDGMPAGVGTLVASTDDIRNNLDNSRPYIYSDSGDDMKKIFYCDEIGCDKNGWYIGLPYLDQNDYITNYPWIDVPQGYNIVKDGFSIYYRVLSGFNVNGIFYPDGYYHKLNHDDFYTKISNEILDGIITGTSTISNIPCYTLTAPVTMNGGQPALTDYNYVKISSTPASATTVNDYNGYLAALNNHTQYITIGADFHILNGVNRGVRFFTGEYYELHSNYYYAIDNPYDETNDNKLSFVGWIVEGSVGLSFYCDRNGQCEGGMVGYPIKTEFEPAITFNNYPTVIGVTPTYTADYSPSDDIDKVYNIADLIHYITQCKDFQVMSGYDITYNAVTYENGVGYITTDDNASLISVYKDGVPHFYTDFTNYEPYIEYGEKLFQNNTFYKNTIVDCLIYDNITLNKANNDTEHEFFFIADFVQYDDEPQTYTSVGSIDDLKAAITSNDEFIYINTSDLWYNGLRYISNTYYQRCTITINGHLYQAGDVLRKKIEKKFYPKEITVKAQKCQTCTAVYAYQFTPHFCPDTTCMPPDWANGLAYFYDGVRMAWHGRGPLFDHTLFSEGHTLTPYIYTGAWADGTECLTVDGYMTKCWSGQSVDSVVICPPSQLNDFTKWVEDVFDPCTELNFHVTCRKRANINDPAKVDSGFEYDYLRYDNEGTTYYYHWNTSTNCYESYSGAAPSVYHIIYSDFGGSYSEPLYRRIKRGLYRVSLEYTTMSSFPQSCVFTAVDEQECEKAFLSFTPILHLVNNVTTPDFVTYISGYYLVTYEMISLETEYSIENDNAFAYMLLFDQNYSLYYHIGYYQDNCSAVALSGCFGINFYFIGDQQLNAPTITQSVNSVTITDNNSGVSGVTIYYTTNGSTPTTSSTVYSGSFNLSQATTTVKAFATANGYISSDVTTSSMEYYLLPPTITEI